MIAASEFLGEMAHWVARCSVQACALIALILIAQFALRNRLSPRWRYALWLLLLLKLALPWTPESRWSVYNLLPTFSQEARLVEGEPSVLASPSRVGSDVAPVEPELQGEEIVIAKAGKPDSGIEIEGLAASRRQFKCNSKNRAEAADLEEKYGVLM